MDNNNSYRRFIITGGCGFIGSCLIRYLSKDDQNIIVNIDKLTYSSNIDAVESAKSNKNYKHFNNDICDTSFVKEILNESQTDTIIHLAAETHVDRSIDSPEAFIKSNILGSYSMLENALKYWNSLNQAKKDNFLFVLVSTDEVYGSLTNSEAKFTEESPYKPNSPYSATKAAADHLARAWLKTYNFPVIITNTSNNYGPWQFPEKLIPLVINKCLKKERIPIYGDGKQIRDWIFVEDHIDGIMTIIEKGKIGEKYNIGSNNEIQNIDVVNDICSILDIIEPWDRGTYSDLIEFVTDRPGHDIRYALDNSKILKLGWEPEHTWEEGLKKTIEWYLNNRNLASYSGERIGKI